MSSRVWLFCSFFPGGRHRIWTTWTAYRSMLSFDTPKRERCKMLHKSFNWHKHCVTTWREPRRRRTEKQLCKNSIGKGSLAKSTSKGAAERLKPGYCLTSLSQGTGKNLYAKVQQMAKSADKGAAECLKPRYCLTSLSEGTRKTLCQIPTEGQKRWQGRCGAFEARVLPNVAF